MSIIERALRRAKAPIHLALAIVASMSGARPSAAAPAEWLPRDGASPEVLVFPPAAASSGPEPITVMLHGMCGAPENECAAFSRAATKRGFLICPRGPIPCAGGGSTWPTIARAEVIEAAVARVAASHPGAVDLGRRTLVGFSLGAFVASELVSRDPARWPSAVLLSAKIEPRIERIATFGAGRLLLGAGDLDLSRAHMMKTARRLGDAGVETTFVSMGKVGHRFAVDMDGWMDSALSWVEAR